MAIELNGAVSIRYLKETLEIWIDSANRNAEEYIQEYGNTDLAATETAKAEAFKEVIDFLDGLPT